MNLLNVNIYTDGACSMNPGAGGWAGLILIKGKGVKEKVLVKGGEKYTTNNRMELLAVIESIKFVNKNLKNKNVKVKVYSDSAYVVDPIVKGSLNNWKKNGWMTTRGTEVANRDLWEELGKELKLTMPEFTRIKGHSGNKFNDYVDEAAVKESTKYKNLLKNI